MMTQESLLDALGAGGPDALVDGERLLQVGGSFMIVAVLEDSSGRFLPGHVLLLAAHRRHARWPAHWLWWLAGRLAVCAPGRQFSEAVEHLGLLLSPAEIAVERQGMQVTGFGRRVVAGQLLHEAEFVE